MNELQMIDFLESIDLNHVESIIKIREFAKLNHLWLLIFIFMGYLLSPLGIKSNNTS